MAACERWQQATSQNIASASVPGYKKTETAFSSVMADSMKTGGTEFFGGRTITNVQPEMAGKISLQGGTMRSTGSELDFAVQGPGFFQVQRPDGSTGYTRDGEFHLTPERTLVNKQGFAVMTDGGPLTFRPEGGRVSVNADGTVIQGSTSVGKIPVYDLDKIAKLKRIGDGLMAPADNAAVAPMEQPNVLNNTLETSNVQPMEEMVNLITVSRAYESAQKIVQTHDEALDKAIQVLGNPN